jgi:hypothetical protein
MIWKYILGWFALLIAAIINGAVREAVYKQSLGELTAHQLSTLIGIILFGIIIWGMTRLWPLRASKQAWIVGAVWVSMTICFEFVFGHYVMGNSWQRLLHDYNILEGRLWPLVLVWTLIAPYLFTRLRRPSM